jgi:hypothetical protein
MPLAFTACANTAYRNSERQSALPDKAIDQEYYNTRYFFVNFLQKQKESTVIGG